MVTEDICLIPEIYSGMFPGSNTYILGMQSGDLSLVDVGIMGDGDYRLESMGKMGINPGDIKRIVLTHTHLDHMGSLPEIRGHMPQAELWMHEYEAGLLEKGDDRVAVALEEARPMLESQYGFKSADFLFKADRKLQNAETLNIGGMAWKVLHVPGHSPGSIALYELDNMILIPGDVAYADHGIGNIIFYGANSPLLYDSLRRLGELEVDMLLPGHNEIVKDLPPGYLAETTRLWKSQLL